MKESELKKLIREKKVIAFDLDGTISASKFSITNEMSELLNELLDHYEICVISGGNFDQFEKQLLSNLKTTPDKLARIHLMPTTGARYFRYDKYNNGWIKVYENDLSLETRERIKNVLEKTAKELGLWEKKTYGEIIEDRGTQVTFSALGQQAPLDAKLAWDPDRKKRELLRRVAAEKLPDLTVHVGGKTSVDVTKKGVDKLFGLKNLREALSIRGEEVLYIGDELKPGGNDYEVEEAGFKTIQVRDEKEAAELIEKIIKIGQKP